MKENIPLEALRTILSRGGILDTDEMAKRLWQGVGGGNDRRGLQSLVHEYQMLKVAKATPTVRETADALEKLIELAREGAEILDRDLTGGLELNFGLSVFGADTAKITEALHSLDDAATQARAMIHPLHDTAAQARAMGRRTDIPQRPRTKSAETWLLVELYRAYCELSGKSAIGRDGPLHDFVEASISFLNSFSKINIAMPSPDNFRQRLRDALDRLP